MAVDQNQWYHFGVGAPPILLYFSGDWDVHWQYDLDFEKPMAIWESRPLETKQNPVGETGKDFGPGLESKLGLGVCPELC